MTERNTKSGERRARSGVVAILALTVLFAAGCGAARPSKYYQLTIPGDSTPAPDPNPFAVNLLIGRLTAPELYREDQIVYSSSGEDMGTYEYHRWAEPPTEMIPEILLRQLRASSHFRGVYLLRSGMRGDFALRGHLYDFKEVSSGSTLARLTIELELRDMKSGTIVWTHFYSHDEPAKAKDIEAIVAALDRNVQRAVAEFVSSLDEYFAAHPPTLPPPNS